MWFLKFFIIKKHIVTCQFDIVPRGRDIVMWQWQCHVLLLDVKSINVVLVFIILSQFGLIFFKLNQFHLYIKFNFYINFQ